jgi:hypothetical protein
LDAAAEEENNEETGENNEGKEDAQGEVGVDSVGSDNSQDADTSALQNAERSSTSSA